MPNPVSDFIASQNKLHSAKTEKTQQLWHQWDQSGRQAQHLEPIISNFAGLIGAKVREWKPPNIPKSVFEAEVTKHVVKAIESYTPDRGANLNTHVNYRIQKAKRYMAQQQNLARIPEAQVYGIGPIQKAQDELREEFGRDPTHAEVGSHLGMPAKRVATILGSMRRDIPSSMWESDPELTGLQRGREILPLLREGLTPREQGVFDHTFGYDGAPVITNVEQLAKRLSMSSSQIYRIKNSIANKYKSNL
jgi:DNA-directed RNA polymerase specialized sigma subunit